MTLPVWDYSKPNPEAFNPLANLLPKIMDMYSTGMKASYLPKQLEAQIALNQAKAKLAGEQAKYYGPNIQSMMGLRNIQQQLYGAQSEQTNAQARKLQMMMDLLSNPSEENQGNGQVNNEDEQGVNFNPENSNAHLQNVSYEPLNVGNYNFENPESFREKTPARQISEQLKSNPQGKSWGVPIPQPSKKDLQNKILFGLDTYSGVRNQALQNQNLQQKGYLERSVQTNNEANESNKFKQLLDRYNQVMDKSLLTGPYASKVPINNSAKQQINSLANEMRISGVERLRSAMGNARFSNLDMQVASTLKPDISWTPKARKFYTEFMNSINNRTNEKAQFYRIASDPRMGIPYNVADSLWASYYDHHPLVNPKSEKLNEYKKNNWMSYLTPQAIKAIQEKGDYKPKDEGLKIAYTLDELRLEKKRRERSRRG